jgi:hypothetical protein
VIKEADNSLSGVPMAVGMGTVLAVMTGVLIFLIQRNPNKAKKVALSFLRGEVKMALKIFSEGWDFFSDSWVLFNNVMDEPADITNGILIPWIIFYCIATIVSIFALTLQIRILMRQLRQRRDALSELDDTNNVAEKLKKHQKRLNKTKKQIQQMYCSCAVGAFECIPMGILQIGYLLRLAKHNSSDINLIGLLSLITTWMMLGMKVSKIPELHGLWKYQKKQKKKCASLAALNTAGEDQAVVLAETDSRTRVESVEMHSLRPTAFT